jgi:hypothetical protein
VDKSLHLLLFTCKQPRCALGSANLDELVVEGPDLLATVPLAVEGEGEKILDDEASGGEQAIILTTGT